jgi:hypothetical protein
MLSDLLNIIGIGQRSLCGGIEFSVEVSSFRRSSVRRAQDEEEKVLLSVDQRSEVVIQDTT